MFYEQNFYFAALLAVLLCSTLLLYFPVKATEAGWNEHSNILNCHQIQHISESIATTVRSQTYQHCRVQIFI